MLVRSVAPFDIDVTWHTEFQLYVRKFVDHHHHHHPRISSRRKSWNKTSGPHRCFSFRCVVLCSCVIFFTFFFSITCWWNKVAHIGTACPPNSEAGSTFHTRGPTAVNDLSSRRVLVYRTTLVKVSDGMIVMATRVRHYLTFVCSATFKHRQRWKNFENRLRFDDTPWVGGRSGFSDIHGVYRRWVRKNVSESERHGMRYGRGRVIKTMVNNDRVRW